MSAAFKAQVAGLSLYVAKLTPKATVHSMRGIHAKTRHRFRRQEHPCTGPQKMFDPELSLMPFAGEVINCILTQRSESQRVWPGNRQYKHTAPTSERGHCFLYHNPSS